MRPTLTRCGWTAPYSHRPANVNAHVISFKGFTNELAFVKYSRGAVVDHGMWTRRTVQSPPTSWGRAAQTWSLEGLAELPARFALGLPTGNSILFHYKVVIPFKTVQSLST